MLVNGKRSFSETTNRAGTWMLTDRDGQKYLQMLSDDLGRTRTGQIILPLR
jgi:hypothetical protein